MEAHKPDDSLYKSTQPEQPAIVSNEEYHISFAPGINYPEMLLFEHLEKCQKEREGAIKQPTKVQRGNGH